MGGVFFERIEVTAHNQNHADVVRRGLPPPSRPPVHLRACASFSLLLGARVAPRSSSPEVLCGDVLKCGQQLLPPVVVAAVSAWTGPGFVTAAANIGADSGDEGVGSSAPAGQANGRLVRGTTPWIGAPAFSMRPATLASRSSSLRRISEIVTSGIFCSVRTTCSTELSRR
jgi:hypothetical protein